MVRVGPEQRQYYVHKALLTRHSDYFRNAFNGSWKEADENSISFEDVDTTTFELFVHWLYCQDSALANDVPLVEEVCRIHGYFLQVSKCNEDLEVIQVTNEWQDALFMALTKAIAFGDKFLCFKFFRAAHNALVDFVLEIRPISGIALLSAAQYAWDNLPEDSKINRFFLPALYRFLDGAKDLVKEMTEKRDISKLLMARFIDFTYAGDHKDWRHHCKYHEHTDDQERKDCIKCRDCEACKGGK